MRPMGAALCVYRNIRDEEKITPGEDEPSAGIDAVIRKGPDKPPPFPRPSSQIKA